jgi:hypothetical protein
MQEAAQKDVERAFGVLQARFAIVRMPAWFWKKNDLHLIMKAYVILHNMIIEDEGADGANVVAFEETEHPALSHEQDSDFHAFLQRQQQLRDNVTHYQFRNNLIEHIWEREGLRDD